jgi:hypothetical protein
LATKRTSREGVERRTGGDRRSSRSTLHFPERRSGFDRRESDTAGPIRTAYHRLVRDISDSPGKTAVLMGSIVGLNVADILFTFHALGRGLEELNPVMAELLGAGHGVAAIVKIGVTSVLAATGWWFRRFRRVIVAALLVFALMSLLTLYHLLNLLTA